MVYISILLMFFENITQQIQSIPLLNLQYSGLQVALFTFLIDLSVLLIIQLILYLLNKKKNDLLKTLEKELKQVDPKVEIAKFSKINKKIRNAKKLPTYHGPNMVFWAFRLIIPMILFRKCWVFTANGSFFGRFSFFFSFPNTNSSETDEIKIGFISFWFILRDIDVKLINILFPNQ